MGKDRPLLPPWDSCCERACRAGRAFWKLLLAAQGKNSSGLHTGGCISPALHPGQEAVTPCSAASFLGCNADTAFSLCGQRTPPGCSAAACPGRSPPFHGSCPIPRTIICLVQDVEDVSQLQGQLIWLLGHVGVDTLDLRAICRGTG